MLINIKGAKKQTLRVGSAKTDSFECRKAILEFFFGPLCKNQERNEAFLMFNFQIELQIVLGQVAAVWSGKWHNETGYVPMVVQLCSDNQVVNYLLFIKPILTKWTDGFKRLLQRIYGLKIALIMDAQEKKQTTKLTLPSSEDSPYFHLHCHKPGGRSDKQLPLASNLKFSRRLFE